MNKLNFTINGTAVVLFFGFACFRNLSELWNVPGYQGVVDKLAAFGEIKGDLTFDQIEMMGDVVLAALKANPEPQPQFTRDEILDDLMTDLVKVIPVVTALVAVVQKPASNPQPVKGSGKGKPAKK